MENILIVGGYGAVGRVLSKELSRIFPGKVIVAGRQLQKAQALVKELGGNAIPLVLDINGIYDPQILNGVALVIMCIDQTNTHLIGHCIERHIDYIDITANQALLEKIELLHEDVCNSKIKVVLGVGLAPGVSNLLARHCLHQAGAADLLELYILLGLGEKHGTAAYRWTLENIHKTYKIKFQEGKVLLQSFTQPKKATLSGRRTFYLFDFADQHRMARLPGVKQVFTRLAFDSRVLTFAVAQMRKLGMTRLFRNKKLQDLLIPLFKTLSFGSDVYQLRAVATKDGREYTCSIKGYGEARLTAFVTVIVARLLMSKPTGEGVMHIDELITDIPNFMAALKEYDPQVEVVL